MADALGPVKSKKFGRAMPPFDEPADADRHLFHLCHTALRAAGSSRKAKSAPSCRGIAGIAYHYSMDSVLFAHGSFSFG